jgi:hypothetical protein
MSNLPSLSIVTNFTAFRRLATIPAPAVMGYFVRGRQGYGDAGMGLYAWDPDETAADNDDSIIKPTDRTSTAGRWVKVTLSGGAAFPAPLANWRSDDIVNSAGSVVTWAASSGGVTWLDDVSQAFFAPPAFTANMGGGKKGAVFDGQSAGARTIMVLNTAPFHNTAAPWSFGLVVNNTRDEASPILTRGYYLSFENDGTSGAPDSTKLIFAEIGNDGVQKSMGLYDTLPDVGSGWHMATETNFDSGTNQVDVWRGLQVLVFVMNPGIAGGSFIMRNGAIIGTFTCTSNKRAFNRMTLGAEFNADDTDQTYIRATIGDHAIWDRTLTEAQAAAWCTEKMAAFGITAWPPAATLPTWANVWYDASRSSDFVRENDRAITKAGNRISPSTHVATQGVAGDKPFLQPSVANAALKPGMVFLSADALAAHTVAALIDGTDDFTFAVIARATSTTNSDGRLVRALNSAGSAVIQIENPFADPQTEGTAGTRHDGTNNNVLLGPSGDLDVHFWVWEKISGDLRLGRDGKYRSVTPTIASAVLDQFFLGSGTSSQEIFSVALKAGGNATAQQLLDEHARAVAYWGCRATPATDEPWQYGATFWSQLNQSASYHEDGSAPGTIDRINNRGTTNVNLAQATDANNPTLVGAGTAGIYADFDGANDELSSGQAQSVIISAAVWRLIAVVWIDAIDTVSANFDAADTIFGGIGFWNIGLRDNTGVFQVLAGHWDGARKTAVGTITLNAWHTINAWYDGSTIQVRINGVDGTPSAAAGNITTMTDTPKMGGNTANTTQQMNGRIRALCTFNAAISGGAVTALETWANAIRDTA